MQRHPTTPRIILPAAIALLAILSFATLAACGGDDDDSGGSGDSPTASGTSGDGGSDATDEGSNGDDGGNDGGDDGGDDGGTDGGDGGGDDGGTNGGSDGGSDGGTDDGDNTDNLERLTVTIQAVGGSGVSGSGTLTPVTAGTEVSVQASGLPGGSHAAMLHHGSCAAIGDVHFPLAELTGSATSTTIIPPDSEQTPAPPEPGPNTPPPSSFIHFLLEDHVLVIHTGPTANPGAAIACGLVEEP